MTSTPPNFSPEELSLSLSEERSESLISSFQLLPPPSPSSVQQHADARVLTLEHQPLLIRLSTRGFSIIEEEGQEEGIILFETLPNLLRSFSPMYDKAWSQRLLLRLLDVVEAEEGEGDFKMEEDEAEEEDEEEEAEEHEEKLEQDVPR